MTDEERKREDRKRAAQAILSVPFFNELWAELEKAAIDACIYAEYTDHEARQAHAAEARAIRRVRDRLVALSKEGDTTVSRRAPA